MRPELAKAVKVAAGIYVLIFILIAGVTVRDKLISEEGQKQAEAIAEVLPEYVVEKNYEEIAKLSHLKDGVEVTAEDVEQYSNQMEYWDEISNESIENLRTNTVGVGYSARKVIEIWNQDGKRIKYIVKKFDDKWKIDLNVT